VWPLMIEQKGEQYRAFCSDEVCPQPSIGPAADRQFRRSMAGRPVDEAAWLSFEASVPR